MSHSHGRGFVCANCDFPRATLEREAVNLWIPTHREMITITPEMAARVARELMQIKEVQHAALMLMPPDAGYIPAGQRPTWLDDLGKRPGRPAAAADDGDDGDEEGQSIVDKIRAYQQQHLRRNEMPPDLAREAQDPATPAARLLEMLELRHDGEHTEDAFKEMHRLVYRHPAYPREQLAQDLLTFQGAAARAAWMNPQVADVLAEAGREAYEDAAREVLATLDELAGCMVATPRTLRGAIARWSGPGGPVHVQKSRMPQCKEYSKRMAELFDLPWEDG